VRDVTDAFEHYDVPGATRPIEAFVDDLSNWYVRRSRRRFWKSENDADKTAAYFTLYECLVTVSKLLAPTMPFLSEAIYRNLVDSVDPDAPESVHLAFWPEANPSLIDQRVRDDMRLVMRLVSLGHAARNSAQIKVRQPLAEVAFCLPDTGQADVLRAYADVIADELNVKRVSLLDRPADVVTYSLNPLPKALGPRFGSDFPKVQARLRDSDPEAVAGWARALLDGQSISVGYDGKQAEINPDEVEVKLTPAEGYAIAEESQYLAALNIELSEELALEGLAREVVRRVQTLRRDADFNIDDRISLWYQASPRLTRAVETFADYIQAETLADEVINEAAPDDATTGVYGFDGEQLTVGVRR
jgi:isoleucyl-tRNA synthetase